MSITSKTTTGTAVTLTGVNDRGHPTVRVEFFHPKLGDVSFTSSTFGAIKGNLGVLGVVSGQNACITVPRTDFDAALAEARAMVKAERDREDDAIKSGAVKITARYHDGEYLSGHEVYGRAGELLECLGVAKYVEGWGYHVDSRFIDAAGAEFTYAQAAEFARPALEATAAKERAAEDARREKFALAASSGQKVALDSWNEDCCERDFDCSLDIVTEYALPDGTTHCERIHTH